MLDSRIRFDAIDDDEKYKITTLYFTTHKDMLMNKYPEAVSATIIIEFPLNDVDADLCCSAMISPTKKEYEDEYGGIYTDYDLRDLDISTDEINDLINISMYNKEMCTVVK